MPRWRSRLMCPRNAPPVALPSCPAKNQLTCRRGCPRSSLRQRRRCSQPVCRLRPPKCQRFRLRRSPRHGWTPLWVATISALALKWTTPTSPTGSRRCTNSRLRPPPARRQPQPAHPLPCQYPRPRGPLLLRQPRWTRALPARCDACWQNSLKARDNEFDTNAIVQGSLLSISFLSLLFFYVLYVATHMRGNTFELRSQFESKVVLVITRPGTTRTRTRTNTNPNDTEANAAGRSGNARALRKQSKCGVIHEGEGHWPKFSQNL